MGVGMGLKKLGSELGRKGEKRRQGGIIKICVKQVVLTKYGEKRSKKARPMLGAEIGQFEHIKKHWT